MTYTIDKNIPVPAVGSGRNKNPNSLAGFIRRLEKGESFFAPNKTPQIMSATARTQIQHGGLPKDALFTCRKKTEGGVDGTRIWRIS